jgi:hypothetical protein
MSETNQALGTPVDLVLGIIGRAEWERRYAARVQQVAGWTAEEAAECARVGAETYEHNERAAGNVVMFAATEDSTPESEADDEMSYWTDDGED